jgi:hypothetical protein
MSEPTFSSLSVVPKRLLSICFGEEASEVLTGARIPLSPDRTAHYFRHLSIVSQGGWFHRKVGELQRMSEIGGFAYLRGGSCTHEHKEVTRDDDGKVVWVETHGYTVLTSGWNEEVKAVERLEAWCRQHPEEAAEVLEVSSEWLIPAIESQFFTLAPAHEGLGDGNSPEFFFCVLRTIGDLMRFARFHKDMSDLWVVYHSVLRYGS